MCPFLIKIMEISCKDSSQLPLSTEALTQYLQEFLKVLGYPEREVVLYLTEDLEMQALNWQHRQHNQPTDVLAWSYWENDPHGAVLGEIAISLEQVKRQAAAHQLSEKAELLRLLAHGCAHLVGYDHEGSVEAAREMLKMEAKMLEKIGLSHVYL